MIGLTRRGFTQDSIDRLRRVFRDLFLGEGLFSERLQKLRDADDKNAEISAIIDFIDASGKNGICHAKRK